MKNIIEKIKNTGKSILIGGLIVYSVFSIGCGNSNSKEVPLNLKGKLYFMDYHGTGEHFIDVCNFDKGIGVNEKTGEGYSWFKLSPSCERIENYTGKKFSTRKDIESTDAFKDSPLKEFSVLLNPDEKRIAEGL